MLFATLLQRRGCRGFGALLLLVALLGLVVQWSSLASTARLHPNSMGSQKAHPKLPHDPSRAAPGGSLKLLELETANARLKEENANLRTQLRIATDEIQRQLVELRASTDPATSAPAQLAAQAEGHAAELKKVRDLFEEARHIQPFSRLGLCGAHS